MTTLQIASLYIAPVGGLLIGVALYYFTGPRAEQGKDSSAHTNQ